LANSVLKSLGARPAVNLKPYTTLKAGGPAEYLVEARTSDIFADIGITAQKAGLPTTYLGSGSNILPSDAGVPGLVVLNLAKAIRVEPNGDVEADAGCSFQELFLKATQAEFEGMEFAVGIPGTLGGALVSNAGAYRSNIADLLTEIEIVFDGKRRWVEPSFMKFSYRDSILRRPDPPSLALVRVKLKLKRGDPKEIYSEARSYQVQRISKQPPPASAGSFFKNVVSPELAASLKGLPENLKQAGVVPAGFLIEAVGLKGHREGGAVLGPKHANFIVNVGGASATAIRRLAELAQKRVKEAFGVKMEEEVLYLGDWSGYESSAKS
jgi:UDP-N-acetylmuramate dehydrogenase